MRKGIDHFEEKRIDFLVNLLLYTRCIKIATAHRSSNDAVSLSSPLFPHKSRSPPQQTFQRIAGKLSRKFDEASSLESLFLERELIYRQLVGSKDSELRTNVLITAQILVYICP